MKSFYRIYIILTVVFVLFLLIGHPGSVNNNSSNTNRTITLYPRVSPDQTPVPDQRYVSAFQTSTTDSYFVESDQLNIGTQSGTWALTRDNDDSYQQLTSQYIVNNLAIGGGTNYQNTYAYDGVYDESLSSLNFTETSVSDEIPISGTSTGFSGAQNLDGDFETLSEASPSTDRTSKPLTWGSEHTASGTMDRLWYEDGWYIRCRAKNDRRTMHIDSFDTAGISGTLTSVTLYVNYTVTSGYTGTKYIEYKKETDPEYTSTGIRPTVGQVNYVNSSTLEGITTVEELQTLNVKFRNNGDSTVKFDKLWLVVILPASEYTLNIEQEISEVPTSATLYEVCIFGNRSAGEIIHIEVFNATGGWDYLGHFTTSLTWNNHTIDPTRHIVDGFVTIRYRDSYPDETESNVMIDVTLVKATFGYSLDVYYEFEWTGDSEQVVNLSIYDVSSGNQDINAYIWDYENEEWVSLDFTIDASLSNHGQILSSSPERFLSDPGNGLHQIRIRYLEVNNPNSISLNVDYICVNLHFSTDDPSMAHGILIRSMSLKIFLMRGQK